MFVCEQTHTRGEYGFKFMEIVQCHHALKQLYSWREVKAKKKKKESGLRFY